MSVVPSLRSTATTGVAAVALLIANPMPTSAKSCKSWGFVGQAVGANQAQTLVLARANWVTKVIAQWDQSWANYNDAASKWEHCDRSHRQFSCFVNGVPCKKEPGMKAK